MKGVWWCVVVDTRVPSTLWVLLRCVCVSCCACVSYRIRAGWCWERRIARVRWEGGGGEGG